MAEPWSIDTSVKASVTAAIQSTKSLWEVVNHYKRRDKDLSRLQSELEDMINALSLLQDVDSGNPTLMLLEGAISRCSHICREVEDAMARFGVKPGFRDWAKIKFIMGDFFYFTDSLMNYKSTITVGLGTINLRHSKSSYPFLENRKEMIQDTTHSLEIHLQRIDEKLAHIMTDDANSSYSRIDLQNDRAAIENCLRTCQDARSYNENPQEQQSSLFQRATIQDADPVKNQFEKQRIANQALIECHDKLNLSIGRLQERLNSIIPSTDPEYDNQRSRLQEDIEISKQCLEICQQASERLNCQERDTLEKAVADDDTDQIVVTTFADLFTVSKVMSKSSSAAIVGSITDDTLQKISLGCYGSDFSATHRSLGQMQDSLASSPLPAEVSELQWNSRDQNEAETSDGSRVVSEDASDISETSSVFSSSSSSTIPSSFSSNSQDTRTDIAMELVDILSQDSKLRPLYIQSVRALSLEKFRRRHGRLLKEYLTSIGSGMQGSLHLTAIRILRHTAQVQQVTSTLWKLFKPVDSKKNDMVHQLSRQRKDRLNRLNALIASLSERESIRLVKPDEERTERIGLEEEDGEESESGDDETDSEDEGEAIFEGQNPAYLSIIIHSLTQQPAFDTFKENIKYLVHQPATLAAALATCNVIVIRKFLTEQFGKAAQGKYGWISQLDEIGLSKRGIASLLLDQATDPPDKASFDYPSQAVWLKTLADRLARRFSRTGELADLEEAIKLAYEATSKTPLEHSDRLNRLFDFGTRLRHKHSKAEKTAHLRAVVFEWEIPTVFFGQEHCEHSGRVLRAELCSFVILVGSRGVFEASTCAEYCQEHFGEDGRKALEVVADILQHVNFSDAQDKKQSYFEDRFLPFLHGSGTARVESVSRSCLILSTQGTSFPSTFIAAMRWICEAVRTIPSACHEQRDAPSMLLKSSSFKSLELGHGAAREITVFSLATLQELTDDEVGRGCCWTRLFRSAIVVWKSLVRSWGTGLQLPYEMLVRLAAVENYVRIENSISPSQQDIGPGGLIALGFFTALIPIAQDPLTKSIQWHLEITENLMDPDKLESIMGHWLRIDNSDIFLQSKCFIGWNGLVNVLLGTTKGQYEFKWTRLRKRPQIIHLDEYEMGGEVGVGDIIPITLKTNLSLTFKPRSTTQNFAPTTQYNKAVITLSRHVALIYEPGKKTGWLVPQLSWILHLCHIWFRYFNNDKTKGDPVPFAELSSDGSWAAREALSKQNELPILGDVTLSNVLLGIWQNIGVTSTAREKAKGLRIYGLETMDQISEPGTGSPLRELKMPKESRSWLCLVERADMLFFCEGLGQVLEPQNKDPSGACHCDRIPSDRSLLVAHNWCVDQLLKREGSCLDSLKNGSVKFSDGKMWFMEDWPFDTCRHDARQDYWNLSRVSGIFLQTFSKSSMVSRKPAKDWAGLPSPPLKTGALVFGIPQTKLLRKPGLGPS